MLMKRFFCIPAILFLSLVTAKATEQGVVDHCAVIIRDFRQMPEKGIPRDVLRHSKGLAIMTVVKAGFIFSGKGGQGVVVRSEEHTSELQSLTNLVCRLLLEKKKI